MKPVYLMSIGILVIIGSTLASIVEFGDDDDAIKLCGFGAIIALVLFCMIHEKQKEEKNVP